MIHNLLVLYTSALYLFFIQYMIYGVCCVLYKFAYSYIKTRYKSVFYITNRALTESKCRENISKDK